GGVRPGLIDVRAAVASRLLEVAQRQVTLRAQRVDDGHVGAKAFDLDGAAERVLVSLLLAPNASLEELHDCDLVVVQLHACEASEQLLRLLDFAGEHRRLEFAEQGVSPLQAVQVAPAAEFAADDGGSDARGPHAAVDVLEIVELPATLGLD